MLLQDIHTENLHIDSFDPQPGEAWCIYGTNTSGIAEFLRLLTGEHPATAEQVHTSKTEVVTFAVIQEIFEEELRKDDSDYLDQIDPGTPAHLFIKTPENHLDLLQAFHLQDCLDKGFRQLSSGESRKLLLVGALSRRPEYLIIENPYDGIDAAGCRELDQTLELTLLFGPGIIITVNNLDDIPSWCSHFAIMKNGRLVTQGNRGQTTISKTLGNCGLSPISEEKLWSVPYSCAPASIKPVELVGLRNGFARYGDTSVFQGLDLTVTTGQHTLLTGPNGSGKSTLLEIITGDNQNCYANDLRIFGKQRGSGESIWDLKKEMGIVSPALHRNHYIPGSPLEVVLSGFFDSIGVYRQYSAGQKDQALDWLELIGLADKARTAFRRLSYAEQRLCLIARALVKMPRLLILDEPTQSLDQANRTSLLDFLETIAAKNLSTILYASHRTDEYRCFFQQHIELE